jgi:Tfp pilus assembly protein PilF
MRKYLLHILIISFAFFLTPTAQAASYEAEKRLEDAKEKVRNNTDDAMAYASLGIAYHNVHKTKEAIKTLKQAIRIDPDDVDTHVRLGIAYLSLNDRDSDIKQYKILKSFEPKLANKLFNEIYE